MNARFSMPAGRLKSRSATLRSGVIAAVAAVILHLGLLAGSSPARADIPTGIAAYSIPSTSMAPTLLINDYIFAVGWAAVSRGDLVVYRFPKDNYTVYIKRVIGMPGDRIQVIEGRLHINGAQVARDPLADFELRDAYDRP
jgi:signal peptidase I